MKISEIISKNSISAEDILTAITEVGKNGDVIIVKNDGIRESSQYSVIILLSKKPDKSFRHDDSSLEKAMKKVLADYLNEIDL